MGVSTLLAITVIICTVAWMQGLESEFPSICSTFKTDINRNINIPWPTKGMGDADYMYAFQHIVMPVAFDFAPDLVLGKY